jgi:acetyltransferase-like isoleucine patch superfamily enzyme
MSISIGIALLAVAGYAVEIVLVGLAIFPGVLLCHALWTHTATVPIGVRMLSMCMAGAAAYFLYGLTLVLLVGLLRSTLRLNLREGDYPLRSAEAIKWAVTVALKSPASITFLNLLLLTPFAALFYRLMGAQIGRGVLINSKSCADPSLLKIGDYTVIGGHATVLGHSFERGRLILRRVRIGSRVVVGVNAVILPGAKIGDGATIAAGAVVLKGARVAPGSTYVGAPADQTSEDRRPRREPALTPPPEQMESWRDD